MLRKQVDGKQAEEEITSSVNILTAKHRFSKIPASQEVLRSLIIESASGERSGAIPRRCAQVQQGKTGSPAAPQQHRPPLGRWAASCQLWRREEMQRWRCGPLCAALQGTATPARPGSVDRESRLAEPASAASLVHALDGPAPRHAPGSSRRRIPGRARQRAWQPPGADKNSNSPFRNLSRPHEECALNG